MSKYLAIALAGLAAFAVGCGRSSTYQTKDGEVKIERQGKQATYEVTGKDGKVKVTAGEQGVALPDNFPKDVPIFKGATVKMTSTQDKAVVVQMAAPASLADVSKFYQEKLKEEGWEIESTMNMGEAVMTSSKKGNRKCTVHAFKSNQETIVQIMLPQEGP